MADAVARSRIARWQWNRAGRNRKSVPTKRRALWLILSIAAVALASGMPILIVPDFARCGDNAYYEPAFGHLAFTPFWEGYPAFCNDTGSAEMLSYGIFYSGAQILAYIPFVAVINATLATLIFLVYRKYGRTLWDYLLTVPANFYFLVLCFSAQRLKIGICFMFAAMLFEKQVPKAVLAIGGALAHFQLAISVVASGVSNALEKASPKVLIRTGLALAAFAVAMWKIPAVQEKLQMYSGQHAPTKLIAFAGAAGLAIVYSKMSRAVLIELALYAAAIAVVGESRINILVYWVAWRVLFLERRAPTIISALVCLYLAYKSYIYLSDLRAGGTGFLDPV